MFIQWAAAVKHGAWASEAPGRSWEYSDLTPPPREEGCDVGQTQQQAMVTRLNRIEGQVRGIRRMVQEPRLCIEILQQLAAAEAALNRISLAVFKFHVEKCVPDGVELGDPERGKQLTELRSISSIASRGSRYFTHCRFWMASRACASNGPPSLRYSS